MTHRSARRASLLAGLVTLLFVSGLAADPAPYRRQDWRHWLPVEAIPCRSVRDHVLIRDANVSHFEGVSICHIRNGVWFDGYSGRTTIFGASSELDVDHIIPLKWAHDHGAAGWSKDRKAAYANNLDYPRHLIPTARALNRQKGAKGPDAWVPPDAAAHCQYGESWATVIVIHGLTPTPAVRAAIRDLVKGCGPFRRDR